MEYEATNYAEAIREACRLLEEDGCITADYTRACLETIYKMGAYMVLAKGLALPHARPEQGALTTGVSLVVLKHPVYFGHPANDPVKIVFGLAATDDSSHLDALQDIAMFALDRPRFDLLAAMRDPAEAFMYIRNLT